jgi:hypothetical protein
VAQGRVQFINPSWKLYLSTAAIGQSNMGGRKKQTNKHEKNNKQTNKQKRDQTSSLRPPL